MAEITVDTWPITLSTVFSGGAMSTGRSFTSLMDSRVNCGIWETTGLIWGTDSSVPACDVTAFKIGI